MKHNCPFCSNIEARVIYDNENAYLIYDKFPVSPGHILIISKRHISSFFDLNQNEHRSICELIPKAKEIIEQKFNPQGYNIGVNIGRDAGQTILHCHIHVIPRYTNDSENPQGGIRKIINGVGEY